MYNSIKYNIDICPDALVDTAPKAELQVKRLIAVQFPSGTYTIVTHIYVFRSTYIIHSSLILNYKNILIPKIKIYAGICTPLSPDTRTVIH